MFKGVIAGIGLTLVIACLMAFAVVQSGLIPANADATPGSLETWAARTSLDATLRRVAPSEPNPVPLTEQNLMEGVHLFARNCVVCHGAAKGSASPSPIAKGLYQKPPQLATDGVEDDPEGWTFWKVKHGIRLTAMPSFGGTLTDEQIWNGIGAACAKRQLTGTQLTDSNGSRRPIAVVRAFRPGPRKLTLPVERLPT